MRKDKPKNNKKKSKKLKFRMFPTSNIQENPKCLRKTKRDEDFKSLKDSISAIGIVQPLIIFKKKKDGTWIVEDGARRLLACKDLGMKEIPVLIKKKPSRTKTLIANMHREDIPAFDRAKFVKKILDKKIISQRNLAKKLGKDESWISHLLKIASMDKEVIKKVDQSSEPWTLSALRKLSNMRSQDEQLRMIADKKKGGTRAQIMAAQNPIDVCLQFEKLFEQLDRLLRTKLNKLSTESKEKIQVRYEKIRFYFPIKLKKSG